MRLVLDKHGFKPGCAFPDPIPKVAYGKVALSEMADLFADANLEHLSEPIKAYASSRWKNSDSPMALYCTAHLFRDLGKDSGAYSGGS